MTIVSVSGHNTRINDANTVTNWGNDGGGGGIAIEEDITYQGGIAASRKIGTSLIGRNYTHGSSTNMTTTDRTAWMMKITVTNPAVLLSRSSPALHVKIGSDSSNYYAYRIAGNDNYPPLGGWLLIAVDPNIAGYRDAEGLGSPDVTAITYWSVLADFSVGSKSQNVAIDAIDVGAGLSMGGGTGTDSAGDFQDFIDFDEGTSVNRFGYISSREGISFVNGRLAIGQSNDSPPTQVATEFDDTGSVVVWNNGYFASGYAELRLDVRDSGSDIALTSATLIGKGEENNTLGLGYSTTEDTRPVFRVVGSGGPVALTSCALQNWSSLFLTPSTALDTCTVEASGIMQFGADIENCTITTTSASGVACISDPQFDATTLLNNTEFVQGSESHALQLTAPGTYTFTNLTFTGYGVDTTVSGAVFVKLTGGEVSINIQGGNTPTYRTLGASVSIQNTVTVSVTAKAAADSSNIEGARVFLLAASGGDLPADASVSITSAGTLATVTHSTHQMSTGQEVLIAGANEDAYNGTFTITVTSPSEYTYVMASDPDSPATGTITSTAVILNGLTNASGVYQDTGFNYTNDQPVSGRVRKGTASPFYKTTPVSGTIVATTGFSTVIFMVSDE
jgi:hypothetical protein